MSRRLLAKDALPSVAADLDMDAYDKKVIKNYSNPDGTLKGDPFPAEEDAGRAALRAAGY